MSALLLRLLVLALVGFAAWLIVRISRGFVEGRRRAALATAPLPESAFGIGTSGASVRILAFSSEDCSQCHRLQRPALRRVVDALGPMSVEVVEIDGPSSPELTKRYSVLTVPTTVVLDASGRVHAINYGFANAQKLLSQVSAAQDSMQAVS